MCVKYIALAIDRGSSLEDLDDKAADLSSQALLFNKRAKATRRQLCKSTQHEKSFL